MRTYNVITDSNEQINAFPVSKVEANKLVKKFKRYAPVIVEATAKSWYYRGTEVTRDEDRNNGWTLVSNVDGSRYSYFATTSELEYK